MNNQTEPESKLANVDLDQWRRDIDTFAAATASALDAIVNELSNNCSSDGVSSVSSSHRIAKLPLRNPIAKPSLNEAVVKRSTAAPSSAKKSSSPSNGSSRLALIKEKLASRMKNG